MTEFLIQTVNGKVVHDFAFELIKSIEYHEWYYKPNIDLKYTLTEGLLKPNCVPIGSLEFVLGYLKHYYDLEPKPINVPKELMVEEFSKRKMWFGNSGIVDNRNVFIKSMEKYKSITGYSEHLGIIPNDHMYQMSEIVDIYSEWRAFVDKGKLVGLQNYAGEFTMFPNIELIQKMIKAYTEAPISYTLDIGIGENGTFVIEIHPFFSCGLYGYSNYKLIPYMFIRTFRDIIKSVISPENITP